MYNVNAGGDAMNIDLVKLNNGLINRVDIEQSYLFSDEKLVGTDIQSLSEIKLKGYIDKDNLENYRIYLNVNGVMTIPCSLTLKPVDYPFDIEIDGCLQEILDEIDKKIKKVENTIDILPIIWENILMEIPMKVVSKDAKDLKLEGNGWKLITEKEESKEINPELEKLKDLL
jgi:uncharacterized protein